MKQLLKNNGVELFIEYHNLNCYKNFTGTQLFTFSGYKTHIPIAVSKKLCISFSKKVSI